jgi:predicted transcriptional regulator
MQPDASKPATSASSTAPPTPLERFLKLRKIKTSRLARECGYTRQHISRLRKGKVEPTRTCIAAIVAACCKLTGARIRAADLFHLGDE